MLIKSQAGEFKISIDKFEIEDRHLVLVGAMGVWEAKTYIAPREVLTVMLKLLSPTVLLYLLKLPFLLMARDTGRPTPSKEDDT